MTDAEDRLSSHLVEDEALQRLTSGHRLERPGDRLAVGLTDRRLLCVSDSGAFTDVRYDYVSSIESRERSRVRFTTGPDGQRTLGLVGGVLVIGALLVGFGRLSAGGIVRDAVTVGFALATVAITSAIGHVCRRDDGVAPREQLFVGTGILSVVVLASAGLFSPVLVAPLFVVATLAGLVLVRYARRHRDQFNGIGLRRHRETLLTVTTVDGRTIDLAVEADTDVDRTLSTAVYRDSAPTVGHPVPESPAE
ncbi:hypothetical protein ACFO5R_09255 [Halosolutus amylolyticus]|uniref:Uncharacterized protein n=1 Tax=Halosolutus amylolyticus TaxID=2932267 RepID=A0ABD5PQD9_9EURY|nr:hypothetical protein [Halosolutus amylolyticus]